MLNSQAIITYQCSPAHLMEFRKDWQRDGFGEGLSEMVRYYFFYLLQCILIATDLFYFCIV